MQRAWSIMTKTNPSKKSGADKRVLRNRRTLPSRQRTYRHLYARVDRLEDAISHFYNAINELRRRVSTLEKELKRGGGNTRH
jgi:predicted RNase H-like nuclease (RuvC/YqgF family)